MLITYYVIREESSREVVYAGQTANPKTREATYISSREGFEKKNCTVPLINQWCADQARKGTPAIFEIIGTIDFSFLPSDVARECKKQVERCIISAVADHAMRLGRVSMNMHGNHYREHNTGRSLVDEHLVGLMATRTTEEVEASLRASRKRFVNLKPQKVTASEAAR
jgi:hypothetical protein